MMFSVLTVAVALCSAGLTLLAARALRRLAATAPATGPALPASILRPLHGAIPGLAGQLAATRDQRHAAPFEVLAAVHTATDPAAAIANEVLGGVVTDPALHGANRKASQLHNLASRARFDVLVAADDDILPPPHWLTAVTAPLADPTVGLVTCLYRGEPADGTAWSRLAALGLDWQFLPFAAFGEAIGRAQGCYGATMALRRETLDAIGGFAALAHLLADDHALGAAVRRQGLRVVVAPVIPAHVMAEPSLGAVFAHELRWARTIRQLDPGGALGAGLGHPLPWGGLAALLAPAWLGLPALAAAVAARVALAVVTDRALGTKDTMRRVALLPLRDALSFAVWLAALAPGGVTWQGRRYRIGRRGAMLDRDLDSGGFKAE